MRVRISAHPLAGSVGPLALGLLHFKDAEKSFSRKHDELGHFRPYFAQRRGRHPLPNLSLLHNSGDLAEVSAG
jgi:hypothetical protein